jgi:hypothetical protein
VPGPPADDLARRKQRRKPIAPEEITTRSGEMPTPDSSIAGSMPVSRTREVTELAWEDPDAIHLEVGEPDLPHPRTRHRRRPPGRNTGSWAP